MSQIALALVAAALVITCFCLGDDMLLGDGYNAVLWSQPTLRVEEADILWQTDGEWEWEQGGQHLKTTFAALVQYEERTELQLGLQLTTWRFWETGRLQAEKLYIVDSLGNECPGEWDMLLADGLGPFHGSYRIVLDYIPLEARWVEVSYGADVFSFRLELPGQEGHVR